MAYLKGLLGALRSMARQSRSTAFWLGYASVLTLYPRVVNPASLIGLYYGRADDDFLPIAVDWAQVNEDLKCGFNRVAEETESEHKALAVTPDGEEA